MSFEHLLKSSERCFADSINLREQKPEASMAMNSHGHEILASYYLANNDERYIDEIRASLASELERYRLFGTSVRSFPQHTFVLLALAIGDLDTAKMLAALPVDRKNWSTFDSHLTYRICSILGVPQEAKLPRSALTETEKIFITALDSISVKQPYDSHSIESFWRSLRKKRYQLTIFEHQNLFTLALNALERA